MAENEKSRTDSLKRTLNKIKALSFIILIVLDVAVAKWGQTYCDNACTDYGCLGCYICFPATFLLFVIQLILIYRFVNLAGKYFKNGERNEVINFTILTLVILLLPPIAVLLLFLGY